MNKPLGGLAAGLTIAAALLAMQTETFSWIDSGGPKLRVSVAGNGSPAVVFDAGGGGSLKLWGKVPAEVSRHTKAVSYDRAGNGMSDQAANPRDARHIATELHAILQNADVAPPYILVGHSLGGLHARVFAAMYPKEVTGLVLVDPTQEQSQEWAMEHGLAAAGQRECTNDNEVGCLAETLAQAEESLVPPNIPVFLIHVMFPWGRNPFASRALNNLRRTQTERLSVSLKFHKAFVDQIPGAKLIITEKSSHSFINFEEPELVVRTIVEAIEIVRTNRQ